MPNQNDAGMHTIFAAIYANNDSSGQCIRMTVSTLWRATAVEKGHWRGHSPAHFPTGVCVCPPGRNATATAPVKMMTHLYYENKLERKKQRDQRLISQRELIKNKYIEVYREIGAITLLILKQSRLDRRFQTDQRHQRQKTKSLYSSQFCYYSC